MSLTFHPRDSRNCWLTTFPKLTSDLVALAVQCARENVISTQDVVSINTLLDRSTEKRYYNEKTRKESLAIFFPPSSRRRPFLDDNLASLP